MKDSGAVTQILKHGGYPNPPEAYAAEIIRWSTNGNLLWAISKDCTIEPAMLQRTGLTVEQHQALTIERYDCIRAAVPPHIRLLPVLEGYEPHEYVECIALNGDRLKP